MPLFGSWVTNSAQATATTVSSQSVWSGLASTISTTGLGLQQLYAAQVAHTQATSWYRSQQAQTWAGGSSEAYYFMGDELVEHSQYLALAQQRVEICRERTAELEARLEERRREETARYELRRREHEAALARSRELLLAHLTPEQRETFETRRWFVVQGGRTRTRYRIRTEGYTHNIEVLRGADTVSHRLCAHCAGNIPLHDHHLTQKLSLESDEDYFLSIANRSAA